jgi:hypothetical protein
MKFSKKLFNWSAWITLVITYILPYQSQSADGFATHFGYPFSFLTVYKTSINTSLFKTELIDILALAINIFIVYIVINFVNVLWGKVKSRKDINKRLN